jgi:hypothetical protein
VALIRSYLTVFTCQKPQHKRCKFFLWDDDANPHAQAAVLANVQSGPSPPPLRTPSKPVNATGLPTPNSGVKRRRDSLGDYQVLETPSKKSRKTTKSRFGLWKIGTKSEGANEDNGEGKDEELFGWDDTLDEAADSLCARDIPQSLFNSSTPLREMESRRPGSPRNEKREFTDVGHEDDMGGNQERKGSNLEDRHSKSPTPNPFDDSSLSSRLSTQLTADSSTPQFSPDDGLHLPPSTPTPIRFASTALINQPAAETQSYCQLVSQTLTLLASHHITLPASVKQDLITLLNTHDLRAQGIARGRDISRLAIRKKDERIQALIGRIVVLEAEREGWRVARLKQERSGR